jgi:hypothetical protein
VLPRVCKRHQERRNINLQRRTMRIYTLALTLGVSRGATACRIIVKLAACRNRYCNSTPKLPNRSKLHPTHDHLPKPPQSQSPNTQMMFTRIVHEAQPKWGNVVSITPRKLIHSYTAQASRAFLSPESCCRVVHGTTFEAVPTGVAKWRLLMRDIHIRIYYWREEIRAGGC